MQVILSPRKAPPFRDGGIVIPYSPAKRTVHKLKWYLLILILSSPITLLAGWSIYSYIVTNAPGYLSLETLKVTANQQGIVDSITVKEGQRVKRGDPLVTILDVELNSRLHRFRGDIARLKDMNDESLVPGYVALQAALEAASRQVVLARLRVSETLKLFQSRRIHRSEFDAAQESLTRAEILEAMTRKDLDSAVLQSTLARDQELRELERETENLSRQVELLIHKAPFDGTVAEILVDEYQAIVRRDPLVVIAKEATPVISAFLDPSKARFAQIGQRAHVRLPDGQLIPAVVQEVSMTTKKLPSEFLAPLEVGKDRIFLRLKLEENSIPLTVADGMPLSVEFPFLSGDVHSSTLRRTAALLDMAWTWCKSSVTTVRQAAD